MVMKDARDPEKFGDLTAPIKDPRYFCVSLEQTKMMPINLDEIVEYTKDLIGG
jgi:hypothetical protein